MPREDSSYSERTPEPTGQEFLPEKPVSEPRIPPGVGLPPPQVIVQLCEHAVYELHTAAKEGRPVSLEKVQNAAQKVCQNMQAVYITPSISELSRTSENVFYQSFLEEPFGSSLTTHSVKVALLSVYLGQQLRISSSGLHELASLGLVHNVGMMRTPPSLLNKREPLTAEERKVVEEHSRLGADYLAQLGEPHQWLARLVLQVHEREDGSGYPGGLARDQIDRRAKIVGLADVYVALIQARPHRPALKPFDALHKVISTMEGLFEPSLSNTLIRSISAYPIGGYVDLSSGESARVLVPNLSYPMRPLVEVLTDRQGRPLPSPQYLDLVENPVIYIKRLTVREPRRDQ